MDPIAALAFLATLLLSAPAALLPLLAALRPRRIWKVRLAVLSLGFGPILLSFLVTSVMTLLPGRSNAFYVGAVLAGLSLFIWLGRAQIGSALAAAGFVLRSLACRTSGTPLYRLGLLTASFIAITLVGLSLAMPLDENDALEYAGSARQIFELQSAVDYPFIDSSKTGGYYGPWSHALGYISLQVWGFLIQGHATEAGIIKLISPYFALCTAFLTWIWLGGLRRRWAVWGAVVLLSTPLYYLSATANQIDAIRLFAFFCAGMCLPLAWSTQRIPALLACGALVGSALFTHSIGLLAIPIVGLVILLKSPFNWQQRLRQAALVCGCAVALVSYRLIDNVLIFGSPIADVGAVPVYALPQLDWASYFRESRDISTPIERVLYGLFAGLTRPNIYGLSYWLLLVATILYLRQGRRAEAARGYLHGVWKWVRTARRPVDVAALILAIFAGMVVTSMLLGLDAFIKNVRYLLTVQPYVVLFAVAILGPVAAKGWGTGVGRLRTAANSVIAIGFALVCIAIPTYFNYTKLRAFDLVGPQVLDSDARKRSISRAGYMRVPAYATETLPADAYILTFQQAQLAFYGRHRFLSDIDPKLIAFYQTTGLDAAHAELVRLGITHLLLPGYPIPTVYNSKIDQLVADPDRAQLLYAMDGNRLYRLRADKPSAPPAKPALLTELPITDEEGSLQWTAWDRRRQYAVEHHVSQDNRRLEIEQRPLMTLRRAESRLYSGRGPIELTPSQGSSKTIPIAHCGRIYRLNLEAQGAGTVDISIVFYPANAAPQWRTIWSGLLNDKGRSVAAMFDAVWMPAVGESCGQAEMRVVARLYGRGQMNIRDARIESTNHISASETWLRQIAARERSWQIVSDIDPRLVDWGITSKSTGIELYLIQNDRRTISLRSRTMRLPGKVDTLEFRAGTLGRGMFSVQFVCQVSNEDDIGDWLVSWVRRTLNLPHTNTLVGGGRAFAGPNLVNRVWRANARGCERAFVQIDLLHSSDHPGLPEQYARLQMIEPQILANIQDGHAVPLNLNAVDRDDNRN